MRAREFILETSTTSGAVAVLATPMGAVLSRTDAVHELTKYTNTSGKPKNNVSRRFKNSISH
jgi:hypothetical protein